MDAGTARPDPDNFTAAPGAYALVVELAVPIRLPITRLGAPRLQPGRFVYCGSAWGPGGLRARIARHLRPTKPPHWHVDHLTARGQVVAAVGIPGARECDLVAEIAAASGVGTPVPGFGSSDCRRCRSHLLSLPLRSHASACTANDEAAEGRRQGPRDRA